MVAPRDQVADALICPGVTSDRRSKSAFGRQSAPALSATAAYRGTNSIVASRRRGVRKPRTYFCEALVGYFSA